MTWITFQEYLDLVGSDKFDNGTHNGMPRFLNPDYIEARKKVRKWVEEHPPIETFLRFSFEKTMENHVQAILDGAPEHSNEEMDLYSRWVDRAMHARRKLEQVRNLIFNEIDPEEGELDYDWRDGEEAEDLG